MINNPSFFLKQKYKGAFVVFFTYIIISLAIGKVIRWPFDDEIYSITALAYENFSDFWNYISLDVHPAGSYLFFKLITHLSYSPYILRTFSLALTAAALSISFITYESISSDKSLYYLKIIIFSSCPLALSQGDAIRWYPIFFFFISLGIYYFINRGMQINYYSSLIFGAALSINFLAMPIILVYLIFGLFSSKAHKSLRYYIANIIILATAGILGFYSLFNILSNLSKNYLDPQVNINPVAAVLINFLGFFGGHSLGVIQSIILIPLLTIILFKAKFLLKNKKNFFLTLLVIGSLLIGLLGFCKPRSFLYASGAYCIILCLIIDSINDFEKKSKISFIIVLTFFIITPQIRYNEMPFKRTTYLPYDEIINFISLYPDAVIVTTDAVIENYYESISTKKHCVTGLSTYNHCKKSKITLLIENSNYQENYPFWTFNFNKYKNDAIFGKKELIKIPYGIDKTSGIKAYLLGKDFSTNVILVSVYQ